MLWTRWKARKTLTIWGIVKVFWRRVIKSQARMPVVEIGVRADNRKGLILWSWWSQIEKEALINNYGLATKIKWLFVQKSQRFLFWIPYHTSRLQWKGKDCWTNARTNGRFDTTASKLKKRKRKDQALKYDEVNTIQDSKIRRKSKSFLRE